MREQDQDRTGQAMKSRIILVDDHNLFREGLKSLLKDDPRISIVGEASNGREAVKLCTEEKPDLVIIDIAMPELNGIEATRQIIAKTPATKVIALSMHSSRRFILDMLKAGASGYLLKDCAMEELDMAITAVRDNKMFLSPSIAGTVVKGMVNGEEIHADEVNKLTPRENEVLQLLTEGKSSRETADRLAVSVKTIQTHRRNIMDKLGLHHITDLTKYAIQQGIISPDI
jgi:DNA-binding NarL/FixJ family response regulator